MIKRIGYIFPLVLLPTAGSSQSVKIGLGVGLGKSKTSQNINLEEALNYRNSTSNQIYIDATIEYIPVNSLFSIVGGVAYNQKGDKYFDLNYLSVPMMLKLQFGKSLKYYFGGGLYGSILINYNNPYSDEYFANSLSNFDYGSVINTGFMVRISNMVDIYFEYRNHMGIHKVYKFNPEQSYRYNCHYLSVGIKFSVFVRGA